MIVKLNAIDTLFFGSGKPFTMEETSMTDSIFPPTPETIYSFLRSCYFRSKMTDYAVFLESISDKSKKDPTISLRINDYGLLIENENKTERIFPIPQDLMDDKTDSSIQCLNLVDRTEDDIISNYSENFTYKLTYKGEKKIRDFDSATYLKEEDILKYFRGDYDFKPINLEKENKILTEPKIGIRRNRIELDDKLLYRLNMHRLESKDDIISFFVDFNGLEFDTDINRLGGEGKLAFIEKLEYDSSFTSNLVIDADQIFKMYLSSHLILKNDFSELLRGQALLLTGVVGQKVFIGGWDAARKEPKKTVKAIAAGSVLYFKAIKKIDTFPSHIGENNEKGYGRVYFSKVISNL